MTAIGRLQPVRFPESGRLSVGLPVKQTFDVSEKLGSGIAAKPPVATYVAVLLELADSELQALSSGQMLLLRMGAKHAVNIKRTLRELSDQLVCQ